MMENCTYSLKLDNKNIKFNSVEELDFFVRNNYNKIQYAANGGTDVKFSNSFDKHEEMVAKIKNIQKESDRLIAEYDNDGTKRIVAKGFRGVTSEIENMEVESASGGVVKKITKTFREEPYIKSRTKAMLEDAHNDPKLKDLAEPARAQKVKEIITKDLANWAKLGTFGSDLHKVAEHFFNDGVEDPYEMLEKVGRPLGYHAMVKYIEELKRLRKMIMSYTGTDQLRFMSEVKIHDPKSKIAGIIDLIAVDGKGNVHIFDLKASYKNVDQWNPNKINKMYYQLGFYKQLLQSKGIPVKSVQYVPFEMINIDYDKNIVDDVAMTGIESMYNIFTQRPYIMRHINEVIPVTLNSFMEKDFSPNSVKDELKKAYGYDIKTGAKYTSIEAFKAAHQIKTDDMKRQYFVDTTLGSARVYLTGDSDRDDNLISGFLDRLASDTSGMIEHTRGKIRQMIDKVIEPDMFYPKTENSAHFRRNLFAKQIFSRYIDGGWEIVDSPKLDELGIIAFRSKLSKNNTIEFVSLTNNRLNTITKLSKGSTLLGNFYTDNAAKQAGYTEASTNANMEFLKILMFINSEQDTFDRTNSTVGIVRVINMLDCQAEGMNFDSMMKTYKKLTTLTNVDFNLDKVRATSHLDSLLTYLNLVVEKDFETRPNIRTLIDNINKDMNVESDEERMKALYKILADLEEKGIRANDVDYTTTEGKLVGLVMTSLLELKGINIRYEDALKKFSFNNSSEFDTINNIESENVRAANVAIKTAMQAVRNDYVSYKTENRSWFSNYLDTAGHDKTRRYVVGDNIAAYKRLFISDTDGKISSAFQAKDPDNLRNDLAENERKFLRKYLDKLNELRYGSIDDTGKHELKLSGEWFNIPLIRASATSRFQNKSVADGMKEWFSDVLNFTKMFESDHQTNVAHSKTMLQLYNHLDLSQEQRDQRIAENNLGNFEQDLELVLDIYASAKFRKKNYDKVLPILHALTSAIQFYNAGLLDKDNNNTVNFIRDYVKTAIYSEKLLEDNQVPMAKFLGSFKDIVSKMNLSLSTVGGVRESLQGLWGGIGAVVSKLYGPDSFGFEEYRKAIGFMLGDGVEFINSVTAIEELNHIYGMAGMDINILAERMNSSKTGGYALNSRWLFWMNSAPDYFNRMTLLISQMIKDGSFEAHKMVDEHMVYDYKLDKRFSAYASGDKTNPNYEQQKGLYFAMLEDFNDENRTLGNPPLKEGDALPRAYTTKQRESFKSFADSIYGYYDHESKIRFQHTMFGMMMMQFKTWLVAKKDRWAMKGGVRMQGFHAHLEDENGNKLYRKWNEEEQKWEKTTEVTSIPWLEWKGRWQEGICASLTRIYEDVVESKGSLKSLTKLLNESPEIGSNLKAMTFDLAVVFILAMITANINWKDMEDESYAKSIYKATLNSGNDLFIFNNLNAAMGTKAIFPAYGYLQDVANSTWQVMSGDKHIMRALSENVGMLRPFQYEFDK